MYRKLFNGQAIHEKTIASLPSSLTASEHLFGIAPPLYASEPLAINLDATVSAFDAATIDLCLSVFTWAPFRQAKAAVRLHTFLDLRGNIPTFIHITDGKTHDVNTLDELTIESGAFYLLDSGYLDFKRLFVIHQANELFSSRSSSIRESKFSKPPARPQ